MNPALWEAWFPNVKMPENCTYEMFIAARAEFWHQENIQLDIDELKMYNDLLILFPQELSFIEDLLAAKSRTLARLSDARF